MDNKQKHQKLTALAPFHNNTDTYYFTFTDQRLTCFTRRQTGSLMWITDRYISIKNSFANTDHTGNGVKQPSKMGH